MPHQNIRLLRASLLIGKVVIDIEKQAEVGQVEKLIFQPAELCILALEIHRQGLFKGKRFLMFDSVKSQDTNSIYIKNKEELLRPVKALKVREALVNEHKLLKTSILDHENEEFGKVKELFYEPKTGMIQKIEVKQGIIQKVSSGQIYLQAKAIESIKTDRLLLAEDYNKYITIKKAKSTKNFKKVINQAAKVKVKTQNEIFERERLFCLNKKAGNTILDNQGSIIIKKGRLINEELVNLAYEAGKLHELAVSVGFNQVKSSWKKMRKTINHEGPG